MINFDNIKTFSTDFPKGWSFLWSPEEASQIFFLNSDASIFLENFINSSKMITGPLWKPFNERYFKTVEEFEIAEKLRS